MSFKDFINSTTHTATTSLSCTLFGTIIPVKVEVANIALQHAAWTIGIIAGIVAIINGIDNFILKHKSKKQKK
jgi:phage-related protein